MPGSDFNQQLLMLARNLTRRLLKMRQIKGLDIVPGRTMALKPGGYHVMLMDLKQQLKGGDVVPITLTFEDTKTKSRFNQDIKAPVTALGGGNAAMPTKPAMEHKH